MPPKHKTSSDLFDHAREKMLEKDAPLAARMRPRTLDEYCGQGHIVGPGRLLRRAIQADQLSSLIFCGPPGTGKTTLALVIANTTRAHFIALNAVLSGVKDIRDAIANAEDKRTLRNQKTILFIDEVHRFNKAQQDALLPHVENGTVILIGATTENPYFEVNKALVSRSRIFQLRGLTDDDLRAIARLCLSDPERGYGQKKIELDDQALDHLVHVSNGDARGLLNALELAVESTPPTEDGTIRITTEVAEESIQRRAVLYDKDGDAHFDIISAFIKSMRGSDPDAALYWMAKMVYAGEDPRFIFRRMIIFASEDVGMADPHALQVVMTAAQAFDYVGMPEGRFHLAQACLYLATAPKSNTSFAFFDALAAVEKEREAHVPSHLQDGNRDAQDLGHGAGYLYPHAFRDHWVAQQYLPESLQGRVFYQPSEQGHEGAIRERVARRREEQLAAILDPNVGLDEQVEKMGKGPTTPNRWLQRTLSSVGAQLGVVRDKVFALAKIERSDLVLDLNAGSGFLTWEALRRAPEGGVWALAQSPRDYAALQQQAQSNLGEMDRPTILQGIISDLPVLISETAKRVEAGGQQVLFDLIVGRNIFTHLIDKAAVAGVIMPLLKPGGRMVLGEVVPRHTQRLHKLVDPSSLPADLVERIARAEEALYANADDPMINWDEQRLQSILEQSGFTAVDIKREAIPSELHIGRSKVDRWFSRSASADRPTFAQHLGHGGISVSELEMLENVFRRQIENRVITWHSVTAFVIARR